MQNDLPKQQAVLILLGLNFLVLAYVILLLFRNNYPIMALGLTCLCTAFGITAAEQILKLAKPTAPKKFTARSVSKFVAVALGIILLFISTFLSTAAL